MDAKKTIRGYIGPNVWVLIVSLVGFVLGIALIAVGGEDLYGIAFIILMLAVIPLIVGLIAILPGIFVTNNTLNRLERTGTLAAAARELTGGTIKAFCKGRVACTDHFLFVRKGAFACSYAEILWVHKQKFTQRVFLIPVHTAESLIIYTAKRSYAINLGGKDKENALTALIMEIYQKNPKVLVGYSPENNQTYKQMKKAARV